MNEQKVSKNTHKKVPAIRFQAFSGEWEGKNFAEIVVRQTITKKSIDLPRVEYEDIISGKGKLNKNIWQKQSAKNGIYFETGDVLFGKLRPYLKNWLLPKFEGIAVGDFWVLRPIVGDESFIYFLIQTIGFEKTANISAGSKMPRSDWKFVSSTKFHIPEYKEQTQIGDFFQALDDLIAKREQKCAKVGKIKQALLGKLFPQAGEKVPQMRFVGFSGDWEEVTIENICTLLKGKTLSWNDIEVNGKHECILYGNLYTDYGMVIKKINHSTNQNAPNIPRSCVGDVLIPASDTTPTGIARASSLEKKDVLLGGDINILRPIEGVSGSFLSYNINSNRIKLIRLIKGTSVKHLSNSDIKNVELFIAKDKKEQTQIGNLFHKLDTLIDQYQQQITTLKNIKQGYLNKMFI